MDWIAYPLADFFAWTFETVLEPIGNTGNYGLPNTGILVLGFVGLALWMYLQNKYNKAAATDPNQLK
ncbi:MAG: hypothetical protein JKY54_07310 [Flavobacteriales bacterium]|nr:hypothetical protein [Flavobacteriales bacterium]